MRVLGIETSCDETGIAIYDDEKGLLANQLYSQVKLHADYGGVVPELASRDHVRKTVPLIQAALKEAGLTAKDIDEICTTHISSQIFAMVEAVAVKKQKQALDYYYDLLALKEPPMRILYLLVRQFKLLMEVKDLLRRGFDKSQIAKEAKLHPFVAGKYMQQCRAFSTEELKGILEEAADTEEQVKTGRLNDRMSVELFIVKNSGM